MTGYLFKLNPNPDNMDKSDICPTEAFTTSDQTELVCTHCDVEADKIMTGVWECAPSREVIDAYPVHEMMTVISGELRLTHQDGRVETLRAGDTFFIPKGMPLVWEITEKLRKFYMIVE